MSDLESSNFSETAASNNAAVPNGAPEGMLPSGVNDTIREFMAAAKREWDRSGPTLTSGGSANAQTLTHTAAVQALVRGQTYMFVAGFSNAAATTLAVDGLTATAVRLNNAALVGGEIVSGRTYLVAYDGTAYQLIGGGSSLATPVTVANGGTGLGTLTAHNVILGEGTSNVAFVAPGVAGQVLTSTGASADPTFQGGGTLLQFTALDGIPPASNFATLAFRNVHPILQFDTTTQWTTYFIGVMPQRYTNNTGVTVYVTWTAATATSGTIGWDVTFERMDPATDLDADSFATAQTITAATVSGTSGDTTITNVACAKGSTAMDSVVAGDTFRLRIRRDVANDTATGNAEIHSVEIRET